MSQPTPTPNHHDPVWHLVIKDMQARDMEGREKYGTPLQPFNGRDMLQDAYEEALDLSVYLRAAIQERVCERLPVAPEPEADYSAALIKAQHGLRELESLLRKGENEKSIGVADMVKSNMDILKNWAWKNR